MVSTSLPLAGRARRFSLCACVGLLLGACSSRIDGTPPWSPTQDDLGSAHGSGDPDADSDAGGGGLADGDGTGSDPTKVPPFQQVSPAVYLSKVKSLLTGQVATEAELAAVSNDASALKGLIGAWQKTPEYEARMLDFFTMAFQQGEVTAAMIANVTPYEQGALDDRVIQSMRESFGRTAMQLVKEGAPFSDVFTTRRFMLTPALMVAMTWLEERQSGDGGGVSDALNNKLGASARYVMQADTPIPIEQSADPANPNFLTFYAPQVAATSGDCRKPLVVDLNDRITLYTLTTGETMMMFFMGSRIQRGFCVYEGPGILTKSDFESWRMVSIRQPNPGEERTWVYELPKFRTSNELVFTKPHVGFYTTPAFLYTWQTNTSNQARVTANQTLIAGVGRKFDGTLSGKPVSEAALDGKHALPGSDCYNCHISMDPMRQFFRNTFSYYWGLQEDQRELTMPGVYVFDGESQVGSGIAELGVLLGKSKRFATGWVHKLCTWANGAVCDPSGDNLSEPSDPELKRIIAAFTDSNYDWNLLVQELFSSPLITYAQPTLTTKERGASYAVAKKGHLCRLLDTRLGLDDSCGLRALPSTSSGDPVKTIASVLPSDSYSRGQTLPTLANDPGLFFYSGVENICAQLASRVVDTDTGKYRSADSASAIASMVHGLMGVLPPRDATPVAILQSHLEAARAAGASASDALRSTFILACQSAPTVGVGQ